DHVGTVVLRHAGHPRARAARLRPTRRPPVAGSRGLRGRGAVARARGRRGARLAVAPAGSRAFRRAQGLARCRRREPYRGRSHRRRRRNRVHSPHARRDFGRHIRSGRAGEPRSGPAGPLPRAHARAAGRGTMTVSPMTTAARRQRPRPVSRVRPGAARAAGGRGVMLTVEDAVSRIAAGRMIVVVDDADRESEGDIVFAAEHATPALVNFAVKHCRGILCAPMAAEIADRLGLKLLVSDNTSKFGTPFTESVDARRGTSTGTSAFDRARTLRTLAKPKAAANDLVRPGHVFPLRAMPGGVLRRAGHTEAAPDLCRIAGLQPVAAVCEIMAEDGHMMRLPELK